MLPQRVSSIQSCSLSHRTFPAVQWRSYQKSLPDTACCAAAEQQPASLVAPQVQEGEGQSIPSIVPEKRSFYGGLFNRTSARPGTVEVQRRCPDCQGAGTCACKDCSGSGRLKRGGYAKRNMVDMKRIYDSKWTAMKDTMGWRHFRVIAHRKQGSLAFVHMEASCDRNAQLWVNVENLKDRDLWAAGWLQIAELEAGLLQGVPCRACSGKGATSCATCGASGAVLVEVPIGQQTL